MTAEEQATALARRTAATRVGREWRTRCPLHADEHPSLDFHAEGERFLVTCRAGCPSEAAFAALREQYPGIFCPNGDRPRDGGEWTIRDSASRVVALHRRYVKPDGSKGYAWRQPDGSRGLRGTRAADLPLYGAELLAKRPGAAVLITEGEKAADAARKMGLLALATTTGASGCPSIKALEDVRGRAVTLWPDADRPGAEHMRRVAAALRGIATEVRLVRWPEGTPQGHDAADVSHEDGRRLVDAALPIGGERPECPRCGKDACPGDYAAAPAVEAPPLPRLWTLGELARQRPSEWIVEDLIPESGGSPKIVTLTGESGAGKSFVALDMAVCVAQGAGFHGRRTKRGAVLYLAAEADCLSTRVLALGQAVGLSLADMDRLPLTIIQAPLVLCGGPDRPGLTPDAEAFRSRLRESRARAQAMGLDLVLVYTDTLRATTRGSENDDDVVAAYYQTLRALLEEAAPNATAVPLHHTGWQDGPLAKKRERGSSVLRGNSDGALFLEKEGERQGRHQRLRLSINKMRDGDDEREMLLVRRIVEVLGPDDQPLRDQWGRPITSCVLVDDASGKTSAQLRNDAETSKLDEAKRRILAALRSAAKPPTAQRALCLLAGINQTEGSEAIALLMAEGKLTGGNRRPFVVEQGV
ncbi:MAG TPA: AAA family ATPase [Vicinamibacteria bacterium]|nr:AAA family ATPase [Vicinamibacteria bacterium]